VLQSLSGHVIAACQRRTDRGDQREAVVVTRVTGSRERLAQRGPLVIGERGDLLS